MQKFNLGSGEIIIGLARRGNTVKIGLLNNTIKCEVGALIAGKRLKPYETEITITSLEGLELLQDFINEARTYMTIRG